MKNLICLFMLATFAGTAVARPRAVDECGKLLQPTRIRRIQFNKRQLKKQAAPNRTTDVFPESLNQLEEYLEARRGIDLTQPKIAFENYPNLIHLIESHLLSQDSVRQTTEALLDRFSPNWREEAIWYFIARSDVSLYSGQELSLKKFKAGTIVIMQGLAPIGKLALDSRTLTLF